MPAVVSIAISKKLDDLEKEIPADISPTISIKPNGKKVKTNGKDETIATLKMLADAHGMVEVGGGSGCIVNQNGLILTNKHVVSDGLAAYSVILDDGRRFDAEILSRDPVNDIAMLKIAATKLPYLELGDATELELGQSVIAIGNALGMFKNTVSLGIVSGLSRAISAQSTEYAADEPADSSDRRRHQPGNSGGPLVDRDGRVIGVNAAIVSGAQSIGFAIPVNAARRDIDDIKKFGRIRRPAPRPPLRHGGRQIEGQDKSFCEFTAHSSPTKARAIPASSPALPPPSPTREKDIVLRLTAKLDRDHPIQDLLEDREVGDKLNLLVLRNGKQSTIIVTLAERK